MTYEYKVVPAPSKGQKERGVKTSEARFALAIETVLNEQAAEGWEYHRSETLPSIERSGLTGSSKEWRNILIFRRAVAAQTAPAPEPVLRAMTPPVEFETEEPMLTATDSESWVEATPEMEPEMDPEIEPSAQDPRRLSDK